MVSRMGRRLYIYIYIYIYNCLTRNYELDPREPKTTGNGVRHEVTFVTGSVDSGIMIACENDFANIALTLSSVIYQQRIM